MIELHHGDCIEVMRTLPDNSVDSIVTDPPYGLGFMGKAWDALPPGEDWAIECLRVLKPGGHLLAFGGTRTWHRLAVAVEDAGFEIRDSIAWMYGSGFPKSLNVSKAIENMRPLSLELSVEESKFCQWMRQESGLTPEDCRAVFTSDRFLTGEVEVVNTSTKDSPRMGRRSMVPTAAAWERARPLMPKVPGWVEALVKNPPKPAMQTPGEWKAGRGAGTEGFNEWQGWGTALKPAFEPIVMARKPLIGTVAANVQTHGTGALNIDGCRIGTTRGVPASHSKTASAVGVVGIGANRVASELDPNMGRWPANVALDEHMAAVLDGQSGVLKSGTLVAGPVGTPKEGQVYGLGTATRVSYNSRPANEGGASRFFYVAKAPKKERPVVDGIAHATVKPLALMRWLVRLVTPEGGTVLEPFAGSGTTVEACILEGFQCIAIEREAEYIPLIQARIDRQDAA